jgi:tetratricopeptide (TPR) repeat protein
MDPRGARVKQILLWIGCLSLGSVACRTTDAPVDPPAETAGADEPNDGMFDPQRILSVLENSSIAYEFRSEEGLEPIAVTEIVELSLDAQNPVSPFIQIHQDASGGTPRIIMNRPGDNVRELYREAREAFRAEQYGVAKDLYTQAVEANPNYFKSYTYLGNTHLLLGNFTLAEHSFLTALALNPVDYQALLFLGETYLSTGAITEAKSATLRAFMLNRRSPAVREHLEAVLTRMRRRVRAERLMPSVRIEREAKDRVVIRLDKKDGLRWLPLATCLACWEHEEACKGRVNPEEDPLRLSMYRECLVNQAATVAVRRSKNEVIHPDEVSLLDAIENGHLESILYWEIAAEKVPMVPMVLPQAMQARILDYIDQFVVMSTEVI